MDPVNGFLYFTVVNTKNGLYKFDLGHLGSSDYTAKLLIDSDRQTFFIDHDRLRLYIPNDNVNTMMSAFLDGTGITDIRKGSVARPNFLNIASMIHYDERFFWTNGSHVFSELYDAGNRTYYHNYMLLFEKHFGGFNMYSPHAQPIPVPFHQPAKLQALFTAYKTIIQWDVPKKLQFQESIRSKMTVPIPNKQRIETRSQNTANRRIHNNWRNLKSKCGIPFRNIHEPSVTHPSLEPLMQRVHIGGRGGFRCSQTQASDLPENCVGMLIQNARLSFRGTVVERYQTSDACR